MHLFMAPRGDVVQCSARNRARAVIKPCTITTIKFFERKLESSQQGLDTAIFTVLIGGFRNVRGTY